MVQFYEARQAFGLYMEQEAGCRMQEVPVLFTGGLSDVILQDVIF